MHYDAQTDHRHLRCGAGSRPRRHQQGHQGGHRASTNGKLPKGTHITVRGQVQTMTASYTGLAIGFIGAIVLVYLLIVINFQSWTGCVHHHHRAARRGGRHCLDVVDHAAPP